MNTRISFIISQPLLPVIQEILSDLVNECEGTIYIAEKPYEAYQLYRQHLDDTDIFIFSGKMFLYTVGSHEPVYQKPCFSLDGSSTNIKEILLEIILKNRSIDLKRIFIDAGYNDYHYLGLRELLPPDEQLYFLDMDVPELDLIRKSGSDPEILENLNEYVYQTHLRLHRENKIDLSLTRFGTLAVYFKENDIPFYYIHPSKEYIVGFVRRCLYNYQRKQLNMNRMSALIIRFAPSVIPDAGHLIAVIDQVFETNTNAAPVNYQISTTIHGLEILMPVDTLSELTGDFQNMDIIKRLLESLGEPMECCGFGNGATPSEALYNAYNAAEVSKGRAGQFFCITEDGKITGPLGSDPVTITKEPDAVLRTLAEQFDINHRNLQKIITFSKISNTKTVTSEDISRHLQITRKSGNRILNKLVEKGGAAVYKDSTNTGKGRPRNYYELTFLETFENHI